MFQTTSKDLGYLRVGMQTIVEFPFDNIATIASIQTPCDCTTVEWDKTATGNVRITYVPKPVPQHLKNEGRKMYVSNKIFTIVYTTLDDPGNQKTSVLVFTAKIHE
jgi:hypothetical protein